MNPIDLSLYLVLDPELCRASSIEETTRLAVAGGATVVQLRDKEASTARMVETGRVLQAILVGTGIPLIVNDDVEAALTLDADGIHVGQGDADATEVRRRIGPDKLLGLSVHDEASMRALDPTVVDYAGIGPVFATATKPGHKTPIGFDGLARLAAQSRVPTVAIGGLKQAHVGHTLDSGVNGLAVVSAICGHPDPRAAATGLRQAIDAWRAARPLKPNFTR